MFNGVFSLPLYRSSTSSYAWAYSFSCEWFVGSRPGTKPAMVPPQAGWRVERGGVGLQTTAVTRCAAARQATALDPSPRLAVQSTAAAAAFAELGMHLADTGSPVARFRAGLDNPQGLLKTRPGKKKKTFGVSAELANDAKDVYIYLRDGYINAICPLSPALYACVPQPTIASLGVLYPPSGPSFDIGSQPASAALCVTMRAEDPHSHTHTTDESLKKEVGGR